MIPLANVQFTNQDSTGFTTRQLVSRAEIESVLALRHTIFCERLGWIERETEKQGLEYDSYDASAVHFGTYDRSGRLVATVRLLQGGTSPLPMQCLFKPEARYAHIFADPTRVWEVSRLCRLDNSSVSDARLSAHLYRAAFLYASQRGADYLVAAMRRALPRLHRAIPINWVQIGPAAEYYGTRFPYACSMLSVSGDIQLHNPALYRDLLAHLLPCAEGHLVRPTA